MNVSDFSRNKSDEIVIEEYLFSGNNYRLSDLHATMGVEQLKKLEKILKMRQKIGVFYKNLLADFSWIKVQKESNDFRTNYQTFSVLLSENTPFERNDLMQSLQVKGIATRRANVNAHEELPYKPQKWSLPVSEALSQRGIALPLYPELTEEEAQKCVNAIKALYGERLRA
jgi:dTDP-4-amino-4,6-dideoxygalactose transaminase